MEDDLSAAEDERSVELSSIAAIYPEIVIDSSNPFAASLDIPVNPEKPLKIYFQATTTGGPPTLPTPPLSDKPEDGEPKPSISVQAAAVDTHEIAHLPPLRLTIDLPAEYPASVPPKIRLSARPQWIPKSVLSHLKDECERLWEEMGKDQVLYTYIDHLQQAADQAFDVTKQEHGQFRLSGDMKLALLDYDLKVKREQFEKETFGCSICLEPKKGAQCHRLLLCGHVFCIACLQDFYNNCITEGDVDNVKCMAPDCGKDDTAPLTPRKRRRPDRTLNPSELLQIPLEQDTVQRYVRLKRKKKLEADKNTIYCPRQWCQGAAKSNKHPKPIDPLNDVESSDSELEQEPQIVEDPKKKPKNEEEYVPMSERLCVCEDCNFAFCSVCKKGWHGEFARCNPRRQAELNEEEKASLDYLSRFSTGCPTCNAPSQKTHGCNHMICFKCKTHFCYLCAAFLMPDNPYRHFNDFKSSCYMRLWELEQGDGADAGAGAGFVGGFVAPPVWEPEEDSDTESEATISDDEEDLDNLAHGGQDFILIGGDEDSEDEEPAPDQRRPGRNMHIEIVNFAGNGANHRIELPERPRDAAAPPPAPNPPNRRRPGGNRNQIPLFGGRPAGAGRGVNIPIRADLEPRNLPNAAPGQGNNNAQMPAGVRAMGIERFLELAEQDMEDEWDSDELDDEPMPMPMNMPVPLPAPMAPRRGGQRRRGGGGGGRGR